jgi:hypothetical protein
VRALRRPVNLFALLSSLPVLSADYDRKQKWAAEILPGLVAGDPVPDGNHEMKP